MGLVLFDSQRRSVRACDALDRMHDCSADELAGRRGALRHRSRAGTTTTRESFFYTLRAVAAADALAGIVAKYGKSDPRDDFAVLAVGVS